MCGSNIPACCSKRSPSRSAIEDQLKGAVIVAESMTAPMKRIAEAG